MSLESVGFNRTILECKAIWISAAILASSDLIEPYWNVKQISFPDYTDPLKDLIEPYWNVKQWPLLRRSGYRRFNRTILECKAERHADCQSTDAGFNRTILECKAIIALLKLLIQTWFNRTILECKANHENRCDRLRLDLIEPYWNVKTFGLKSNNK